MLWRMEGKEPPDIHVPSRGRLPNQECVYPVSLLFCSWEKISKNSHLDPQGANAKIFPAALIVLVTI